MSVASAMPQEKVPVCFNDNGFPTITVLKVDGHRYGWPLHLLSCWTFVPGDTEKMQLTLGDGKLVALTGKNLAEIVEALDQGKGGQFIERDVRYLSLAGKGRAFITEISVSESSQLINANGSP